MEQLKVHRLDQMKACDLGFLLGSEKVGQTESMWDFVMVLQKGKLWESQMAPLKD
jgi:hypothetical protein